MDVLSPFSLLEVTMNDENNAEDDCIIIDDDDDTPVHNGASSSYNVTKMEEVDPLLLGPSAAYDDKQDDMPTLWITTNITNLAGVPHAENVFRKSQYSNVYEVLTETLHCTICRDHVGCDPRIHPSSIEHPVLRVLICQLCACMYKAVNFVMNEKGKEIHCRWCGKVPSKYSFLRSCHQCPFSFCEECLLRNCPEYFHSEPRSPWTCLACNSQVLWPARATLWALHCLKSLLLANPGNSLAKINGDISLCCKYKNKRKKKVVNVHQNLDTSESQSLDLDQLVPPHLLNGITENELYHSPLPETDFPNSIEPYPNSGKLPVMKQKPKPRPKPRPKSKPKPKTSAASTPKVNPKTEEITVNIKAHWLRPKLIGYINDFDQLKRKLEDIEKSLDFDENDPRTEEKVDNVSTLLSLHRELLNSCRLSLINEWKEKKARMVLKKYSSNTDGVTLTTNETPLSNNAVQERDQKTKPLNTNNRKKSNNMLGIVSINHANAYENSHHSIKDCYVKLKRLQLPQEYFFQVRKQKS